MSVYSSCCVRGVGVLGKENMNILKSNVHNNIKYKDRPWGPPHLSKPICLI